MMTWLFRVLIAFCMALVLSISDFDLAWPAGYPSECRESPPFEVIDTNDRAIEILAYDNVGSDSACAHFWFCVRHLFETAGPGAIVDIGNFGSDQIWIPSRVKRVTFCYAHCMNSPWEEYGEFDSFEACEASCMEEVYDGRELDYDD
jgi:hypothetical protein